MALVHRQWGHYGFGPGLGQSARAVTGHLNFTPSTCAACDRGPPKRSCSNAMAGARWSSPHGAQLGGCSLSNSMAAHAYMATST